MADVDKKPTIFNATLRRSHAENSSQFHIDVHRRLNEGLYIGYNGEIRQINRIIGQRFYTNFYTCQFELDGEIKSKIPKGETIQIATNREELENFYKKTGLTYVFFIKNNDGSVVACSKEQTLALKPKTKLGGIEYDNYNDPAKNRVTFPDVGSGWHKLELDFGDTNYEIATEPVNLPAGANQSLVGHQYVGELVEAKQGGPSYYVVIQEKKTKAYVKDNDTIKPVYEMYIKDNGVLKKIRGMYKKENEQLKGKMF